MRVVVDTNVWVSAILTRTGPPGRVRTAFEDDRFTVVTSEPLLVELAGVLTRPRLVRRYGHTPEDVAVLLGSLRALAELVPVTGNVRVCRDPNDDMVVETAINGHTDVLVSRDDDLKRAPEVAAVLSEPGIRVLSVQHFLDALGEAEAQVNN